MIANNIEELLALRARVRILPFPRYYRHNDFNGSLYGFYDGRWDLSRHGNAINLHGYDTSYTIDVEMDSFISWEDEKQSLYGQPTATVFLRRQLHLWNSCAEVEPISDRTARRLVKRQSQDQCLIFNFDPWCDRSELMNGYAMTTEWRGHFPKLEETRERIPEFWLAARGVHLPSTVWLPKTG